MTALATPPALTARPARSPRLLRWLVRLHRPALLSWIAFVLVVGGLLLWLGGPLTDASAEAWKQYRACGTASCVYDAGAIGRYKDWYTYTTIAVVAVPALVAAWSGAALVSRELESGTTQLAWTQAVSPARWLTAKLAVPAVLVTLGSGLLAGLHHWAWSNSQGRIDTAKNWYDLGTYAANGTATTAMALAGLASGVLWGLYKRNSLGALVGSLASTGFLWSVVAIATPHLWPSVTTVSSLTHSVPAGSGIVVDQGLVTSTGRHLSGHLCGSTTYGPCKTAYAKLDAVSYYNDHHPQSHYWPLQLTATAIILAVTAALTVTAFRLLKHRTGSAPAPKAAAV
ncbi:ABC transporter permease [Streptomyces sp. MBT62]|uniref:ABC transporter permease n=1 Tax=Streptomyces sp. MBT62 TaxID=2800410 RepID=UPI00190C7E9E|nr:ABC transporter permease [Streptomyces sp. MBT62]MBK3571506.1 ABC transporter permease [Streptomyces sp. MBT62]